MAGQHRPAAVIHPSAPEFHRPASPRTTRLELRDGMTFDAWMALGRRLGDVASASAWWLGDWLVYGERTFGSRYRHALGVTGLDYQTLRNYAWVARRFEPSRRRDGLSLQHHAEVAALPDAERDLWLSRAERARWSRNELRRQVRSARRLGGNAPSPATVVYRLTLTMGEGERWSAAAAASGRSLEEWVIATIDEAADAALVARPSDVPHDYLSSGSLTSGRRRSTIALQPGSRVR